MIIEYVGLATIAVVQLLLVGLVLAAGEVCAGRPFERSEIFMVILLLILIGLATITAFFLGGHAAQP